MSEQYHVKVTGPGINFERDVPEQLAQRVLVAALTGDIKELGQPQSKPSASAPSGVSTKEGQEEHADSIANYLNVVAAKTIPQKIAAIANFMKKNEGKATFKQNDLEEAFENAAESVPGNLSRDVKDTVRSGWIAAKRGERGTYYVTGPGSDAVKAKFEGHGKGRKKGSRKAAAKAAKKSV